MRVTFKKLFVLLVLLGLAGCMTSKKPAAIEEAFPGLPDGTEVVLEEPIPDTGDEIIDDTDEPAVPEPDEVCTPVEIIPVGELPDGAVAGEDYETSIEVRGACNFVTCQLVSELGWVTMDGCDLHASPNTTESLGEHEITIRAYNMRNESESVERTLTLTVRDDPKINLFVSSSDSPAAMKKIQNVNEKDRDDFDVTLGQHYFYARIEGYAEEYDVTIDSDQFSLEEEGDRLYSIALVDPETIPAEPLEATITAETEHGTVSRIFNVRFLENPCDHPLAIERVDEIVAYNSDGTVYSTHQNVERDSPGTTAWKTDVILGKKYRMSFKVVGGIAPYEWSEPVSEVGPQQDCVDTTEAVGDFSFGCSNNVLTTNEDWIEIEPTDPEEAENSVYFRLETDFSFPDKDLPYNEERDNMISDQLTVTATSQGCPDNPPATYTLKHTFTLPLEPIGDIKCEQTVEDVWDVQSQSRMWISFTKGENSPFPPVGAPSLGYVEYKISECEYDGYDDVITHRCEVPTDIARIYDQTAYVTDLTHLDVIFGDKTEGDGWCFDCDYDEADYDLKTLTCYTDYRTVFYKDANNDFDNNVTTCYACDTFNGDVFGSGGGTDYALYPLALEPMSNGKIFRPRIRPNYPTQ